MQGEAPTAILSFNNLMSVGVIRELINRGVKIPEDILVASYGLVEPEELLTNVYKVLCVKSRPYEMGKRAGSILTEKLINKKDTKNYHEKFKPDFYLVE